MADDNEHNNSYNRARDYLSTFYEFANIVHNYDDTAYPDHDNINYVSPDYDGAEYDHNGHPVIPVDYDEFADVAYFIIAVYEHDNYDGLPTSENDHDPTLNHYDWYANNDDCGHRPNQHRHFRCYEYDDDDTYDG